MASGLTIIGERAQALQNSIQDELQERGYSADADPVMAKYIAIRLLHNMQQLTTELKDLIGATELDPKFTEWLIVEAAKKFEPIPEPAARTVLPGNQKECLISKKRTSSARSSSPITDLPSKSRRLDLRGAQGDRQYERYELLNHDKGMNGKDEENVSSTSRHEGLSSSLPSFISNNGDPKTDSAVEPDVKKKIKLSLCLTDLRYLGMFDSVCLLGWSRILSMTEIKVAIGPQTPMKKLFDVVIETLKKHVSCTCSMPFLSIEKLRISDGWNRLVPQDTAEQLELEDGDGLVAYLEHGGPYHAASLYKIFSSQSAEVIINIVGILIH